MSKKILLAILFVAIFLITSSNVFCQQALDPEPPDEIVKLIFIHHSTGENWLTDGYGNLGRELGENNYFVSDTNYGWGPDAIGDRTDIPDWMEWFRGNNTSEYMNALFNESGQNSSYTRTLTDPGGENQIVIFKSCFPNSELTGNPNDAPGTVAGLSVSGAKYVYNQLLAYFAARPDKLFVVITAPPVSDSTYARNARAFNQWLMEDWLEQSGYEVNNVAVFDFYNVLTDKNAHHHLSGGQVEYVVGSRDTLAYPSGDDHPSEKGSRKATEEFIPLLNTFYNKWKESAPTSSSTEASVPEPEPQENSQLEVEKEQKVFGGEMMVFGLIDDFEGPAPAGSNGWESFWDEATTTSMICRTQSEIGLQDSRALMIDFDITPNDWGTCALFYDDVMDWGASRGLTFYLKAAKAGLIFDINLYADSVENYETYLYTVETTPDSVDNWVRISVLWEDFHRADWEENAGTAFSDVNRVAGIAFGFNAYPDTPNTGVLWVDELSLMDEAGLSLEYSGADGELLSSTRSTEGQGTERGFSLPCGSALMLPAFFLVLGLRKNSKISNIERVLKNK